MPESDISFNVLEDAGLPYEEILRESQRYDLVLFGHDTHFRFGTVDQPDETLWKVLKRGPRPVVIAPPKLEPGSSVVVAYNGSPQADRALQAFQSSAWTSVRKSALSARTMIVRRLPVRLKGQLNSCSSTGSTRWRMLWGRWIR